ncbi:nucleolar protein 9-like [Centruroides sculpturatus]|uniref:nucleolar protein 9-like n=1 Tax=Centruroides sculpturatus TaxID=218467 RepID=UPI000C6DAC53|nr:nucleolar protein 9-like [Centruroides sculpturatus]
MEKKQFKSSEKRKNYEDSYRNSEFEMRTKKKFKHREYQDKTDVSDKRFNYNNETFTDKRTNEGTSKEDSQYFEKVLEKLKIGFDDDDDKELFIENVLKEIGNKVVELSCGRTTSYLLQSMLDMCNDANLFIKFMNAISSDLRQLCTNQSGSHIVESLLKLGVKLLQDETKPYYSDVLSSLVKFGKYCLNNTDYFLCEVHAAHILRSFVETLGGIKVGENICKSRKSRKLKKKFQTDNKSVDIHKENTTEVILAKIPDEFALQLEEFYNKMSNRENLVDCCMDSKIASIIQTLLVALHKRIPERCQKFIKILMKQMCMKDSEENLPLAFMHQSSSCIVEKLLELSNEKNQHWLWKHIFQNSIKLLVVDRIANFIAQRFFKVVQSKEQLQVMLDDVFPLFKIILRKGFPGIIVSIAEACVRLGTYQPQFMQVIMKTFKCDEPEERQIYLAPMLMMVVNYKIFSRNNDEGKNLLFQEISYHGSLIIQHILHFYKPYKIVNSMLAMKDNLKEVACDPKGSRIFDAFLSSQYVGEKNREKLLQIFQPHLAELACNKHGSRTVDALWEVASLKQRTTIAQKLTEIEETLNGSSYGFHLSKKCALFHFKNRNAEWKQIQEEEIKKRKLFKDFLN